MDDHSVLTVPALYENIKVVCDFVADGARRSGMPQDDIFHIELACDEACTNVIEHAYGGEGKGDIHIQWQVLSDQFVITIKDNGRSFDPKQVPTPTPPTSAADELKVGGLGLHFMRKLMDDIQFEFGKQENILRMVKNIGDDS